MMEKKGRGKYTREFKEDAVRLVTQRDVKISQVALDLGIHENTIYKWIRQYKADPESAFPGKGLTAIFAPPHPPSRVSIINGYFFYPLYTH